MAKNNFILLLALLMMCGSEASQESGGLRACKTNVTADQCPPNTSCKQKENAEGFCTCLNGYEFNKNFTSNDTYCVVTQATSTISSTSTTTSTTTTTTTTTTKSPVTTPKVTPVKTSAKPTTTTTTTKAPEKTTSSSSTSTTSTTTTTTTTTASPLPVPNHSDGVDVKPVIEPEHMIGGVLLPLIVVATFIGGVFLIRKHNLLERAHSYITERNWHLPGSARPNYTNDFDEFDDPLLI